MSVLVRAFTGPEIKKGYCVIVLSDVERTSCALNGRTIVMRTRRRAREDEETRILEQRKRQRRQDFGEAIYRRIMPEHEIRHHLEEHPDDVVACATGIKVQYTALRTTGSLRERWPYPSSMYLLHFLFPLCCLQLEYNGAPLCVWAMLKGTYRPFLEKGLDVRGFRFDHGHERQLSLLHVPAGWADILVRDGGSEYYKSYHAETVFNFLVLLGQDGAPIVEELLAEGADINAVDSSGKTPLAYAMTRLPVSVEVVDTLLKNQADLFIANNHGRYLAKREIGALQVVKWLLSRAYAFSHADCPWMWPRSDCHW